jgi:hypothetical protein
MGSDSAGWDWIAWRENPGALDEEPRCSSWFRVLCSFLPSSAIAGVAPAFRQEDDIAVLTLARVVKCVDVLCSRDG